MAQNHYTTKTKRRPKNSKRKDPTAATMAALREREAAAKKIKKHQNSFTLTRKAIAGTMRFLFEAGSIFSSSERNPASAANLLARA